MEMSKKDIANLKQATMEWLDKAKAKGVKITTHECPYCHAQLETPQPTKKEVTSKGYWDSCKTCYECGKMSFVMVWPTGKTKVKSLEFSLT